MKDSKTDVPKPPDLAQFKQMVKDSIQVAFDDDALYDPRGVEKPSNVVIEDRGDYLAIGLFYHRNDIHDDREYDVRWFYVHIADTK